jgi:ABC-type phosphate transport system permease subunit
MKIPKWDGIESGSEYFFTLVCFVVGYVAVTVLSLGQIKYDDRESQSWSPVSRMPDGKMGLSEFAIGTIGFAVLGIGIAVFIGLALLWRRIRLS